MHPTLGTGCDSLGDGAPGLGSRCPTWLSHPLTRLAPCSNSTPPIVLRRSSTSLSGSSLHRSRTPSSGSGWPSLPWACVGGSPNSSRDGWAPGRPPTAWRPTSTSRSPPPCAAACSTRSATGFPTPGRSTAWCGRSSRCCTESAPSPFWLRSSTSHRVPPSPVGPGGWPISSIAMPCSDPVSSWPGRPGTTSARPASGSPQMWPGSPSSSVGSASWSVSRAHPNACPGSSLDWPRGRCRSSSRRASRCSGSARFRPNWARCSRPSPCGARCDCCSSRLSPTLDRGHGAICDRVVPTRQR